ncbi:exopolysaccharide biosynthesis protein [Palleronia sp.]|uniref:exopolysaccharide biosynthesis protein n=1 Tax=Palleronia sp. TaxID=1940284 RepID=UPI0035C80D51
MTDILDDLEDLASDGDEVRLKEVVGKIGRRGQGTFLAIPGLIGMTPVGGIPGVPTLFGATVAIVSLQMLVGRNDLWLPGVLARWSVEGERIDAVVRRIRKIARWMDRHFGRRLEWATGNLPARIAALLAFVFACLMPPLELVPFAGIIPFAAIALLGVALTMRDGLLMLVAFVSSAAALWGMWRIQPFI